MNKTTVVNKKLNISLSVTEHIFSTSENSNSANELVEIEFALIRLQTLIPQLPNLNSYCYHI